MKIRQTLVILPWIVLFMVAAVVTLYGDALATPPQNLLNWEWRSTSAQGQVSLTTSTVTLLQAGFPSQPGQFPTQSIIVSNDGTTGTPSIFFTVSSGSAAINPNRNTNGNASPTRRILPGDPPLSLDGRFKFFSIIRGVDGNNANQNARMSGIY